MLKDNSKRLLCSITTERDFYAQGQLQETSFAQSLLKETYLNNYKELNKVLNTWYTIRGIHKYNTNRTYSVFLRHLRILRYELLKEFSKLLMFFFRRFAQSIGLFACCIQLLFFSKSLSLYIEDLRDVEN